VVVSRIVVRTCGLILAIAVFVQVPLQFSLAADNPARRPHAPVRFAVHRVRTNGGVDLIIPPTATDQELKDFLRYLRKRVQAGEFKDLGIHKPTDKRFGKSSYRAGMILVYRGGKCADESVNEGICGYGLHADGYYAWGLPSGNPKQDYAVIRNTEGEYITVFTSDDGSRQ
jgi:hypothetical protein